MSVNERSSLILSMWKEVRGSTEAQQCGIELSAVEFAVEDNSQHHMQLGQVSIDGFSVTWILERAESIKGCTITLRFNFLSKVFRFDFARRPNFCPFKVVVTHMSRKSVTARSSCSGIMGQNGNCPMTFNMFGNRSKSWSNKSKM